MIRWLILVTFLSGVKNSRPNQDFESAEPATFGERLKRAEEILRRVPLIDGQNNLAMSLHDVVNNRLKLFPFTHNLTHVQPWASDVYSHTDLPRLKEGLVSGQLWSAWVPCEIPSIDPVAAGLDQVDVIKRLIGKYPEDLELAKSSDDIMDAFKDKKIASMISIDGGHMINNSLSMLRLYYDAGVRFMSLTHKCNTPWAESCCGTENDTYKVKGLNEYGQLVIGEMNRLGMMIDLTHSSVKTMKDVLKVTGAPVIFSHSGAKALCNYSNNVPDEILLKLKKNQGIIMINFGSNVITCSGNSTLHDVIEHINYIRNITDIDHIGLGSNFNGFDGTTMGLENVSKFPYLFAELLLDPNWTEDDLEKLAGQNFLRAFKMVEKVKSILAQQKPTESKFENS